MSDRRVTLGARDGSSAGAKAGFPALPPELIGAPVPSPDVLGRLVYVVGSARGGTTMLGQCVGLHDRILALPENSNFLGQVWRYARKVDDRMLRLLIAQPRYYKRHEAIARLGGAAGRALQGHITRLMRQRDLAGLYTLYPIVHGLVGEHGRDLAALRAWSDKATDTRGLAALERAFPALRAVFILRDPRASVASLTVRSFEREARNQGADRLDLVAVHALHWRRVTQDMLHHARRLGTRAMVVRYEDFVRAPVDQLNRIFEFAVGEALPPSELERRLAGIPYFASAGGGASGMGIKTESIERWRQTLTADELAVIEAICGRLARRLGYETRSVLPFGAAVRLARIDQPRRQKLLTLAKLGYLELRTPFKLPPLLRSDGHLEAAAPAQGPPSAVREERSPSQPETRARAAPSPAPRPPAAAKPVGTVAEGRPPFRRVIEMAAEIGLPRTRIAALLLFHLVGTLFESFGLGMLLPVFDLIQKGGDAKALAAQSGLWRVIVDVYGAVGLEASLPALLVTSFLAILARQGLVYLRMLYTAKASLDVGRAIRIRVFGGILKARLSVLEDDRRGHIVNDITTETDRATQYAMALITLGGHLILGLVYFAMMLALSMPMTGAAVGVLAIAALPALYLTRHAVTVSRDIVDANRALVDFFAQRLGALRFVRLSGAETAERNELDHRVTRQNKRIYRSNVLIARTKVVIEPVVVAAAFIFLFVGHRALGVGLEELGLFLLILLRLVPVMRETMILRNGMALTRHSLAALQRRFEALDRSPEGEGGSRTFGGLAEGIRFEHVAFTYAASDAPALIDVDVTLPARRLTALVGPSGSGKSTLIDLLPRLREPSAGVVWFDGVPASAFSLKSLRAGIAYAPQTPQLFDTTIAEHIRYGRPDSSRAEIEAAARLAGAHAFIITLPAGYETRLGEAGELLSGGQRQRIDLARALVKDASILILDEPTSQLDAESEEVFKTSIRRIRDAGRHTIVMVAHRLSTAAIADQVVVMMKGRVVDVGTHRELLARGGWYAEAFRLQQIDTGEPVAGTG